MTDYIKEFGDGQKGKTFIPEKIKREIQPKHVSPSPQLNGPETITVKEVKDLATDLVLELMNADARPPTNIELLSEQKTEIEQKIQEYCNRPGILSLTYHADFDLDETSIGAMIDPTNTKNWALLKEEIFYKLPHSYRDALHTFASEVWSKRGLTEGEVGADYIAQLKQEVNAANKQADGRYHEVYNGAVSRWTDGGVSDPNLRTIFGVPSHAAHQTALQDGEYQVLKRKARDLEEKLRKLEKRVKKI